MLLEGGRSATHGVRHLINEPTLDRRRPGGKRGRASNINIGGERRLAVHTATTEMKEGETVDSSMFSIP